LPTDDGLDNCQTAISLTPSYGLGRGLWSAAEPGPGPARSRLAHRGVLFLDEFAEFPRSCSGESAPTAWRTGLSMCRGQPETSSFPAKFILVTAMNPCPCGFSTDEEKDCTCSPLANYKLSKEDLRSDP
jgi:predicted ATPase with chaperone activity